MDEIALKILKIDARKEALRRGFSSTISTLGASMLPAIRSKDKIVIMACDKERLRCGDVIVYQNDPPRRHIIVAHRIVRKIENKGGCMLITKGDTLIGCDRPISADMVLGRVVEIRKPYITLTLDSFAGRIFNLIMLGISLSGFLTLGLMVFNKLKNSKYGCSLFFRNWRDLIALISFLRDDSLNLTFKGKLGIIKQLNIISFNVKSLHTQDEILNFMRSILSLDPASNGVIVEAGCYKGGSTAKFSLAADIMGKEFVVFDSFQGIPENNESDDMSVFSEGAGFKQGDYCGTLEEVKTNVMKFGKIKNCRFVQGWFENTMPEFKHSISAIYLDVDLASSTHTCLKYLYPLLEKGGVLYSHDGHIPLVIDVFNDDDFWMNEVGCKKPHIPGLGKSKLIKITK